MDRDCLQYCLSKYEIHYILHLAAQPIVRICHNDPHTAYMTNVIGTLNLLEACRSLTKRPEKIIVMTSDKAYGPHEKLPYVEDAPLVAADSYCTSKACQDMLARSFGITYGLPVVVVRAGNLYGPGDLNTSRLIPRSILRLFDGLSPVLYSGVADYVREFIYIDNVVKAYETLFMLGSNGEAYNVGGTPPQKIGDVITMIRDKVDPSIEIDIIDKDFFDLEEQYLDASKLMSLGWKPEITLDEGLDRSIEWYREYHTNRGW
jgi:CDP-glucose 4,6-dehydratase